MANQGSMDLRGFAREHHVHCDVRSEDAARTPAGTVSGYEVRLFASHDGAPLSTPTCDRCHALREGLRTFAQHLATLAGKEQPGDVELLPDPSVLYTASDDPRRDEVMLTVRLPSATLEEDSILPRLRRELAAAGVEQRA